jgi:hypothetical protein
VWVEARGAPDEELTEPEPKNDPLCAASSLIRDETSRPLLAEGAPALPECASRASRERIPKPTAAAPADATFTNRARRRAGASREGEGVELTSP